MTADTLSRAFAALADPTRRDMVARLSEGDATVSQLAEPYEMSLQAVYKHLRVLEDAGLVSRPCTNASFSVSITCSRSAWPALSRSRAAAAGSSGPVITGTPSHDTAKRNAAAPQRLWAALSALRLCGAADAVWSSTFNH